MLVECRRWWCVGVDGVLMLVVYWCRVGVGGVWCVGAGGVSVLVVSRCW